MKYKITFDLELTKPADLDYIKDMMEDIRLDFAAQGDEVSNIVIEQQPTSICPITVRTEIK